MKRTQVIVAVSMVLSALLFVCKFGTEEGNTRTVKSLQVKAEDVSQWTEDQDGFKEFSNLAMLTVIMNGGADLYYNQGVIEGFIQYMSKTGTDYKIQSRVMDFGTAPKAVEMYDYIIQDVGTKQGVGSYGLEVALVDPDGALTGCKAYAHFGQYFIELALTDYGSKKTEATNNAVSFIEVFKTKIDQL